MLRTIFFFGVTVLSTSNGWSQAQIQAIVNSASYQTGVVEAVSPPVSGTQTLQGLPSGGALATAFVSGVTGAGIKPGTFAAPSSSPLPFSLDGVAVSVNGAPAPILFVYVPASGESAYAQINFQMPFERNAVRQGSTSCADCPGPAIVSIADATVTFPAGQRGMGGFFSDANGYAIARHASDNTLITVANPARAGETIIAYADDFFDVWPPPPLGLPVPSQPSAGPSRRFVPASLPRA